MSTRRKPHFKASIHLGLVKGPGLSGLSGLRIFEYHVWGKKCCTHQVVKSTTNPPERLGSSAFVAEIPWPDRARPYSMDPVKIPAPRNVLAPDRILMTNEKLCFYWCLFEAVKNICNLIGVDVQLCLVFWFDSISVTTISGVATIN